MGLTIILRVYPCGVPSIHKSHANHSFRYPNENVQFASQMDSLLYCMPTLDAKCHKLSLLQQNSSLFWKQFLFHTLSASAILINVKLLIKSTLGGIKKNCAISILRRYAWQLEITFKIKIDKPNKFLTIYYLGTFCRQTMITYWVFKKTHLKEMCDFLTLKIIGTSIDQNKKSPSFWPNGQKMLILH